MPVFLQFHGWSGKDAKAAAGHLSGVLKLTPQKAMTVLEWLAQGRTWKFPRAIADRQARQALDYFNRQGFELKTIDAPPPPPPPQPPPTASPPVSASDPSGSGQRIPVGFHGNVRELTALYITNALVVTFTFGLGYAWAKTRLRSYLWSQSSLGSDRLVYHGTWKELFFAWIKLMGILILLGLVGQGLYLLHPDLGSAFDTLLGLVILVGFPAVMVGAMRYRLSRTSWRGIRFTFRGDRWEAVLVNLGGTVLMGLTLGLAAPWYFNRMTEYWRSHAWFGNLPFRYDGVWNDLFKDYFVLWLFVPAFFLSAALHPFLSLLVLIGGLVYGLWFWARVQRYIWDHTHIGEGTFEFSASAKDLGRLLSINSLIRLIPLAGFLLVGVQVFWMIQNGTGAGSWVLLVLLVLVAILSIAVAKAWITCRNYAYRARFLVLSGFLQLDRVVQEMKESGALSDDALDWMDVPLDVI